MNLVEALLEAERQGWEPARGELYEWGTGRHCLFGVFGVKVLGFLPTQLWTNSHLVFQAAIVAGWSTYELLKLNDNTELTFGGMAETIRQNPVQFRRRS
jgi:hypothetical protein